MPQGMFYGKHSKHCEMPMICFFLVMPNVAQVSLNEDCSCFYQAVEPLVYMTVWKLFQEDHYFEFSAYDYHRSHVLTCYHLFMESDLKLSFYDNYIFKICLHIFVIV